MDLEKEPETSTETEETTLKVPEKFQKLIKEFSNDIFTTFPELKENIEKYLVENNLKMKELGPVLRIILTGKTNTPDIFKVIFIIGRNECIKRLTKVK